MLLISVPASPNVLHFKTDNLNQAYSTYFILYLNNNKCLLLHYKHPGKSKGTFASKEFLYPSYIYIFNAACILLAIYPVFIRWFGLFTVLLVILEWSDSDSYSRQLFWCLFTNHFLHFNAALFYTVYFSLLVRYVCLSSSMIPKLLWFTKFSKLFHTKISGTVKLPHPLYEIM